MDTQNKTLQSNQDKLKHIHVFTNQLRQLKDKRRSLQNRKNTDSREEKLSHYQALVFYVSKILQCLSLQPPCWTVSITELDKQEKIQAKLSLGSISTHKELMLSSETSYETKGGTLDSWLGAKLMTSIPTHLRCHYRIKLISKLVYVYLRNDNSKSS